MTRATVAVAAATVVLAAGCVARPADDDREADTVRTVSSGPIATTSTTATSTSTSTSTSSSNSSSSGSSHHATVHTDAGRIEASSVDGELEVDVVAATGWEHAVDRQPHHVRVASTSAGRSVVVDLWSVPGGISQEVVTTD